MDVPHKSFLLRILESVTKTLQWVIVFVALAFSTDYLSGDFFRAGVVEVGDRVNPTVWGVACGFIAVIGVAGAALSNWRLIMLSASCTVTAFGMFAATAFWSVIHLDPWDDWRLPAMNLGIAAIGGLVFFLAMLMDDIARDECDAHG